MRCSGPGMCSGVSICALSQVLQGGDCQADDVLQFRQGRRVVLVHQLRQSGDLPEEVVAVPFAVRIQDRVPRLAVILVNRQPAGDVQVLTVEFVVNAFRVDAARCGQGLLLGVGVGVLLRPGVPEGFVHQGVQPQRAHPVLLQGVEFCL